MEEKEFDRAQSVANWAQLIFDNVDIIVPVKEYDLKADRRLLIPFKKQNKIGFVNQQGEVIVKPQFDVVKGDCYCESDLIHVGVTYSYAYERAYNHPATYMNIKWGLINLKGECVLEPQYSNIVVDKRAFIVHEAYGYGYNGTDALLNAKRETLIPYGKYFCIETFFNGLSRCRGNKVNEDGRSTVLYGIINELGIEVIESRERFIPSFKQGSYINTIKELMKNENPQMYNTYFP